MNVGGGIFGAFEIGLKNLCPRDFTSFLVFKHFCEYLDPEDPIRLRSWGT